MNLISVYTREQAIEDGVLMRLDEFISNQQEGMTLNERMRFSEAMGEIRQNRIAKVALGELVITAAATGKLDASTAIKCLMRHEAGDWGELCEEDWEANENALKDGSRLFSVYEVDRENENNALFYVITEWNREATTILLSEDY